MIYFLKGVVFDKNEETIVLDVNGIGYEVYVPSTPGFIRLSEGEEVVCYTYMAVKEDGVSLYGFENKEMLNMFKKLITVNGVGAKAGISILSTLDINNIKTAIALDDADSISKANGIGKKTAQKIILELKDKIGSIDVQQNNSISEIDVSEKFDDTREESINALISLGYTRLEARNAVSKIGNEPMTIEEIIKEALKK